MSRCLWDKCNAESERNGFCEVHYWHNIWLDNTDPNNLGIVKFANMVVPTWTRNATPWFHFEMYRAYLALYNPELKDKYDRLLGVIGFRGAAKTTFSKIILLYVSCFGLEKFVVYCSETNTFAVQDVFEVRRELSTNPHIRHYFGVISSKGVKGNDGEWSRDAFLTSTGVYVLARGVGQQVRSALRNSYRPTLAIINDMYSKDSVKTEYTRAEYAKWFFQDMFNAIDDIEGKVFFNGTILHQDTVPVTLENNPDWKILKYPVMEIDDFHRVLTHCKITDAGVEIPPPEVIAELEKTCKLAWPQRLNLNYILKKYREAIHSQQGAGFYQEYFHIVTPPGERNFENLQRLRMEYFYARGVNWLRVHFDNNVSTVYPVRIFLGVDPASSTQQGSKFTAIVFIAMNQYRQVFVMGYSHGKFATRDEFLPGFRAPNGDIVTADRTKLKRIGMVDEVVRLVKQYHATSVTVETTQMQQTIFDEILRLKIINNAAHSTYSEKPIQDKVERDSDILTPYFQSNAIFFNYGLTALELELKHFPRGSTVDIIDSLAYAVKNAKPADDLNFQEVMRGTPVGDQFETDPVVL